MVAAASARSGEGGDRVRIAEGVGVCEWSKQSLEQPRGFCQLVRKRMGCGLCRLRCEMNIVGVKFAPGL